jgi:hypothetical protein
MAFQLIEQYAVRPEQFPSVRTLALYAAAADVGEEYKGKSGGMSTEVSAANRNAVKERDAFRARFIHTINEAFQSGSIGLEWLSCPAGGCPDPTSTELIQDAAEDRYRSFAFDIFSDDPQEVIGGRNNLEVLCESCKDLVGHAAERLREQVWAYLCWRDGEEMLEDPLMVRTYKP